MSMKYLGETIDIHGGGEDNLFPHHENEIAQSEAASGKKFVRYWMHVKHVLMNGEKMSKSKGNFITVRDAVEKYGGLLVRFFFLNTHYRKNIDFNEKDLLATKSKMQRIISAIRETKKFTQGSGKPKADEKELMESFKEAKYGFKYAMDDDFNTSLAVARLLELVKSINTHLSRNKEISSANAKEIYKFFEKAGKILFGDLFESDVIGGSGVSGDLSKELIDIIIDVREYVRNKKDFEAGDFIRAELKKSGISLEDSSDGVKVIYGAD